MLLQGLHLLPLAYRLPAQWPQGLRRSSPSYFDSLYPWGPMGVDHLYPSPLVLGGELAWQGRSLLPAQRIPTRQAALPPVVSRCHRRTDAEMKKRAPGNHKSSGG